MIFLVGLTAIVAVAVEPPALRSPAEPSCILEALPTSARLALVDAFAEGVQSRTPEVLQENESAIRGALAGCAARYGWTGEQSTAALRGLEYRLRLEASKPRLQANGVKEDDASKMFESLPSSMYEAIFGKRAMTQTEMKILQPAFQRLVKRLDGPDGNALSEYVTARAGIAYFTDQLLAH